LRPKHLPLVVSVSFWNFIFARLSCIASTQMARIVPALALITMFLGACAGECLTESEGQCLDVSTEEARRAHGQQTALLQMKSTVGEHKMQSNSSLSSQAQEAREGQSPEEDEEEPEASNEKEDEEADSTNEKKTKESSSVTDKETDEEENSANDRKSKKRKSANDEENSANDRKAKKSDSEDEEEEDSANDRRSKRSNSANGEDSSNDRSTKRRSSANEEEDSSMSAKSSNEDYVDNAKSDEEKKASGEKGSKVLQAAAIAPFGKEDTARELQHHASRTQDTLVDAIENAEVAEIKRSIFRSLTRLRAAEIKEFDTIARLETQAIDEYNDNHHYRAENPLDYIHSAETKVKEDKYTSFHD